MTSRTENDEDESRWFWRAVVDNLPLAAIIVLGLVGISWTSLSSTPTTTYWVIVTPIIAIICIVAGWHHTEPDERRSMVITQLILWAAVLAAKYLITVSDVQRVLNINATGLMTLTLLALGVFVSGLTVRAWKVCLTGAFLAVCVPVVAWVQNASVFLLFFGVVLIALLFAYWWIRDRLQLDA